MASRCSSSTKATNKQDSRLKAKRHPRAAYGQVGPRTKNWLSMNQSSESKQSLLRVGTSGERKRSSKSGAKNQKANSANSRQDPADAPHRKGTMPPAKIRPRPQTNLEWAVKGHGERLRHQEQDKTPQVSSENVARKRMVWFPSKMNQQSPNLIVKQIHSGQPPFVSR